VSSRDDRLGFLDLEAIDRDIFRGVPTAWPGDRPLLFGGEVAAQALMAAARTVPDDRLPHSLHGYFLRPGHPQRPVVFLVDRDRDGRSFSARRVAAQQNGEVIWEMSCSFHTVVDGPEYFPARQPDMLAPDRSPAADLPWGQLLDVRVPPPPDGRPTRERTLDRVWTRVRVDLPDDPVLHACLHVFASDVSAGFGDLVTIDVPTFGPSIDHAVWLHRATRADEWVIWDCSAQKVGGQRGLYTGAAHTEAGELVLMLAQEMLLRPPD